MLYPATYPITVLQNSTWRGNFRVTESAKTVPSMSLNAGVPTFTAECHNLSAGDKVVFSSSGSAPCGLDLNTIYYVIAAGLTVDAFQVSATDGGSAIVIDEPGSGSVPVTLTVAKPINLTGCTIDSDIVNSTTFSQVATFTVANVDATNGAFELLLTPATTLALAVGSYNYDLSITNALGERYYYLRGTVTVERTYSRI